MRQIGYILILTFSSFFSRAQNDFPDGLEPYFTAVIVNNMDSSLIWYQEVLGYEVLNQKHFPEMGFKQANLSNGQGSLELIKLSSAISPQEVIPNYNTKTKIVGLFKFGFQVENFDQWIDHLQLKDVQFNGRIVTDELTNKRMIIVLDPDGNRIQLFEK